MPTPPTDELLDIVAETLRIDRANLNLDTPLSTLGADSIAIVEMVFAIEDRYGLQIPLNANTLTKGSETALSTVGDVVEMVQKVAAEPELA